MTAQPSVPGTPAASDAAGLTTGAVARRIGVAPTTLRSWDRRYGIGPAARENGRHRRWAPRDIAVLDLMNRLTGSGVPPAEAARHALAHAEDESPPDTSGSPETPGAPDTPGSPRKARRRPGGGNALALGNVRQECRGLARAAVRLDAPAVQTMLETAVTEHGLLVAWEEVIVPALRAVGLKWAVSGERYVEVEHLLSWHVSTVLRGLMTGPVPDARIAPVLLACAPEDQHTLPLEAVAAGLAQRHLPVRMFGAAVPAEALLEAVRRTGPTAVLLWSQSRTTADQELTRRLGDVAWGIRGARTRPVLMLAGPGWAGRPPLPGALRPTGLRDTLTSLRAACDRNRGAGARADRAAADPAAAPAR
ncbi:MerR family transcriptional regulator [Streptomyces sp. ACA25]|uniref:MerR family transcriptional regulator n=1 Tax=Streptomyces sp. ACA25 TaxID=3022596 RepID=UPI0023080F04|nr:MerR family transcriptional regulator [Streptomyces sp. ACA25]MDB1086134.1 MerR family transcriptional regulator [Streptomyces sp. ACA25]